MAGAGKRKRIDLFIKLIDLFEKGAHLNLKDFTEQILPVWDELRVQKQANSTFQDLEEAIEFAKSCANEKGSSETIRHPT
jgi:hypothetical protein